MIDLAWKAEFISDTSPFVVKVVEGEHLLSDKIQKSAQVIGEDEGCIKFKSSEGKFKIFLNKPDRFIGDILLCIPRANRVQRLFREASKHNSILLTERCDQLCAMCSQPPKTSDDEWKFPYIQQAINLLRKNAIINITGGEPTLYKNFLFNLMRETADERPDIKFHVLSNGQHFTKADEEDLTALNKADNVTWGIPLYSHDRATHDLIVGKEGAFEQLVSNLIFLLGIGTNIELRTVLTKVNALHLPHLAKFISRHIPRVNMWAIMAMEPIGFARANRDELFFDHSIAPYPLESALELSGLFGVPVSLYNFPRCTVNSRYRDRCMKSISEWKNKYLDICSECDEQELCTGFFEWYNEKWHWQGISPIKNATEGAV